ncbi:MAG: hypothetical protein HY906_02050 [Deltaproteobacteria bacterium]|nr:hypothetical protein [Deltaproteobacteria bacterium]
MKTLLSSGLLSTAHVERALKACARDGAPLWRHLCAAADISDEELCDVIARAADLPRCTAADLAAVDLAALALVPADLCRLACVMPVRVDAWGTLVVAMADPFDEAARAEVEYAAGRPLRVELATERTVREAIARLHGDGTGDVGPQYLYDEDDLQDLFAAAEVPEADILEIVEVGLTAEEPPSRRAAG